MYTNEQSNESRVKENINWLSQIDEGAALLRRVKWIFGVIKVN